MDPDSRGAKDCIGLLRGSTSSVLVRLYKHWVETKQSERMNNFDWIYIAANVFLVGLESQYGAWSRCPRRRRLPRLRRGGWYC